MALLLFLAVFIVPVRAVTVPVMGTILTIPAGGATCVASFKLESDVMTVKNIYICKHIISSRYDEKTVFLLLTRLVFVTILYIKIVLHR